MIIIIQSCGLQCAPISLGGLRIVYYIGFYVKYFNRIVVEKKNVV